ATTIEMKIIRVRFIGYLARNPMERMEEQHSGSVTPEYCDLTGSQTGFLDETRFVNQSSRSIPE
ncbi:MAG: hypothetical protein R6W76_21945, partial [Caldilinea sp.]